LAEGLGPLEIARQADLGEFASWPDNERLVLNLHRAYAEFGQTEMDILAAFTDAVAYHGGPLHCAV
jgi:cyclase